MMAERVAVVGVGQTKHDACRADVSIAGLVREATDRALEQAGLELGDVDAIVIGKAPDTLEGVVMPELWLADALAASG
ncbi:MAG: thiolase domain-containing protein, partial [Ilumatobacter sp.]|nr:thiolase domain-containing protein [Ilumatobacter sp.]